ncbi:hypothetical protein BJY04DRAFT_36105 [Aspergillus karnatakaensis]|uniref:uncharacterized protein n=1 Tax=Aspergillus karnatakaensis TaxID=1810916 RepID=UPI003CCD872E
MSLLSPACTAALAATLCVHPWYSNNGRETLPVSSKFQHQVYKAGVKDVSLLLKTSAWLIHHDQSPSAHVRHHQLEPGTPPQQMRRVTRSPLNVQELLGNMVGS